MVGSKGMGTRSCSWSSAFLQSSIQNLCSTHLSVKIFLFCGFYWQFANEVHYCHLLDWGLNSVGCQFICYCKNNNNNNKRNTKKKEKTNKKQILFASWVSFRKILTGLILDGQFFVALSRSFLFFQSAFYMSRNRSENPMAFLLKSLHGFRQ